MKKQTKHSDWSIIKETYRETYSIKETTAVSAVEAWSIENRMELNADKCKEMRIDFKRTLTIFHQL